jgi:hypothetical protein
VNWASTKTQFVSNTTIVCVNMIPLSEMILIVWPPDYSLGRRPGPPYTHIVWTSPYGLVQAAYLALTLSRNDLFVKYTKRHLKVSKIS